MIIGTKVFGHFIQLVGKIRLFVEAMVPEQLEVTECVEGEEKLILK